MAVLRTVRSLALLAGLVVAALCAVQLQLDRAAAGNAQIQALVLPAFQSETLLDRAGRALADGRTADALAASKALLDAAPVPQENLSLLARAALADGQQPLAAQAWQAAMARGWRDPFVQAIAAEAALAGRQWPLAAQRIDALQRIGVPAKALAPAVERLAQTGAGRTALKERLELSPAWVHRALVDDSWMGLAGFPEVLGAVVRLAPAGLDCAELANAVNTALARGQFAAVEKLWQGPCAGYGDNGLALTPFGPPLADGAATPFAWHYPEEAGLERSFRQAGADYIVDFRNRDPFSHVLTRRVLRIAPGTAIRLSLASASDVAGSLTVAVLCLNEPDQPIILEATLTRKPLLLAIPEHGCAVQEITVLAGPNATGRGVALTVRSAGSAPGN